MKLDDIRVMFSDAYDGELNAEERSAFQRRLDSNAHLADEYNEFCADREALRSLRGLESTPDLLAGAKRKLQRRGRRSNRSLAKGLRPLYWTMAAIVIVLVIAAGAWAAIALLWSD